MKGTMEFLTTELTGNPFLTAYVNNKMTKSENLQGI